MIILLVVKHKTPPTSSPSSASFFAGKESQCPPGDTLLDLLAGLYEPGLEGFENPPLWVNAWDGENYYYYDYGQSVEGEDSVDPLEVVEVKHEVKVDDEVGSPSFCGGAYVNVDFIL